MKEDMAVTLPVQPELPFPLADNIESMGGRVMHIHLMATYSLPS